MKKRQRKLLYERFKEQNAEKKEMEKLQEHFDEEVVVKKISTSAEIMRILVELIAKVGRFFLWIVIIILCSIGLTVLINESTRNIFLNLFGL